MLKTASGAGYDVVNGFTPIIQTAMMPLFVVSGPASGAKNLKNLVAMAKTSEALSYASPGSGSPMHILGEMFNKAAGVSISRWGRPG